MRVARTEGRYGKFQLRTVGADWISCHAASIPPSLWHELSFDDEPFSTLYVEPGCGGLAALRPLLSPAVEAGGALGGVSEGARTFRALYEGSIHGKHVDVVLAELLASSRQPRQPLSLDLDPRIVAVIDSLADEAGAAAVEHIAQKVGLSPSRFQHLFTGQIGIPFRRYRAWQRLRRAWRKIANGATITAAAHEAGFFDSAHFAHEYRRTFGKACSMYTNGSLV